MVGDSLGICRADLDVSGFGIWMESGAGRFDAGAVFSSPGCAEPGRRRLRRRSAGYGDRAISGNTDCGGGIVLGINNLLGMGDAYDFFSLWNQKYGASFCSIFFHWSYVK